MALFFCGNPKSKMNNYAIRTAGLMLIFLLTLQAGFSQQNSIRIDSVSVRPDHTVIIGWTILAPLTDGYVEIHTRIETGLYRPVANVPLPQTTYIDASANAGNRSYSYYVVLYDKDGNVVGNTANDAHQTLFLKNLQEDICARNLTVPWDNYTLSTTVGQPVILPSLFTRNEVFLSHNEGPFRSVHLTEVNSGLLSFTIENSGRHCFYIRTSNSESGSSASSNIRCINISLPRPPQFVYIKGVNVDENTGAAIVKIHTDHSVSNPAWVIERFNQGSNSFQVVFESDTSVPEIIYTDLLAQANQRTESYRVIAFDSCRHEILVSEVASSLFLSVKPLTPASRELTWTGNPGWPAGVESYTVQRKSGDDAFFADIATVPGFTESFVDELALTQTGGIQGTVYRVKATENPANPYGFKENIFSNTVAVIPSTEIFIPNAFKPDSQISANRSFHPVFPYFQPQKYNMMIFNRWGERIFATTELHTSWDGTHGSTKAPAGIYSYVIAFEDDAGIRHEKRGTLLLVR
jgi:gliding motility-associated-like protein